MMYGRGEGWSALACSADNHMIRIGEGEQDEEEDDTDEWNLDAGNELDHEEAELFGVHQVPCQKESPPESHGDLLKSVSGQQHATPVLSKHVTIGNVSEGGKVQRGSANSPAAPKFGVAARQFVLPRRIRLTDSLKKPSSSASGTGLTKQREFTRTLVPRPSRQRKPLAVVAATPDSSPAPSARLPDSPSSAMKTSNRVVASESVAISVSGGVSFQPASPSSAMKTSNQVAASESVAVSVSGGVSFQPASRVLASRFQRLSPLRRSAEQQRQDWVLPTADPLRSSGRSFHPGIHGGRRTVPPTDKTRHHNRLQTTTLEQSSTNPMNSPLSPPRRPRRRPRVSDRANGDEQTAAVRLAQRSENDPSVRGDTAPSSTAIATDNGVQSRPTTTSGAQPQHRALEPDTGGGSNSSRTQQSRVRLTTALRSSSPGPAAPMTDGGASSDEETRFAVPGPLGRPAEGSTQALPANRREHTLHQVSVDLPQQSPTPVDKPEAAPRRNRHVRRRRRIRRFHSSSHLSDVDTASEASESEATPDQTLFHLRQRQREQWPATQQQNDVGTDAAMVSAVDGPPNSLFTTEGGYAASESRDNEVISAVKVTNNRPLDETSRAAGPLAPGRGYINVDPASLAALANDLPTTATIVSRGPVTAGGGPPVFRSPQVQGKQTAGPPSAARRARLPVRTTSTSTGLHPFPTAKFSPSAPDDDQDVVMSRAERDVRRHPSPPPSDTELDVERWVRGNAGQVKLPFGEEEDWDEFPQSGGPGKEQQLLESPAVEPVFGVSVDKQQQDVQPQTAGAAAAGGGDVFQEEDPSLLLRSTFRRASMAAAAAAAASGNTAALADEIGSQGTNYTAAAESVDQRTVQSAGPGALFTQDEWCQPLDNNNGHGTEGLAVVSSTNKTANSRSKSNGSRVGVVQAGTRHRSSRENVMLPPPQAQLVSSSVPGKRGEQRSVLPAAKRSRRGAQDQVAPNSKQPSLSSWSHNYQIDIDDIEVKEVIGSGHYSIVSRAVWQGATEVVVKQLRPLKVPGAHAPAGLAAKPAKEATGGGGEGAVPKGVDDDYYLPSIDDEEKRKAVAGLLKDQQQQQQNQQQRQHQSSYTLTGVANDSSSTLGSFWREVRILCSLRHPHVVLCLGAVVDRRGPMIVTEYFPKGTLFEVLHGRPDRRNPQDRLAQARRTGLSLSRRPNATGQVAPVLPLDVRMRMAADAACGVLYLHRQKPRAILHRDLKSSNLLVTPDNRVKVADFGLARADDDGVDAGARKRRVSLLDVTIQAPEVLLSRRQNYTKASDAYSFGLLLWEIYNRRVPFAEMEPRALARAVVHNHLRPTVEEGFCDPRCAELMRTCWAIDPSSRPSFDEIASSLRAVERKIAETINR